MLLLVLNSCGKKTLVFYQTSLCDLGAAVEMFTHCLNFELFAKLCHRIQHNNAFYIHIL